MEWDWDMVQEKITIEEIRIRLLCSSLVVSKHGIFHVHFHVHGRGAEKEVASGGRRRWIHENGGGGESGLAKSWSTTAPQPALDAGAQPQSMH